MSAPPKDRILKIIEDLKSQMDEYDDSAFLVYIKSDEEEDGWSVYQYYKSLNEIEMLSLARRLISSVIKKVNQ